MTEARCENVPVVACGNATYRAPILLMTSSPFSVHICAFFAIHGSRARNKAWGGNAPQPSLRGARSRQRRSKLMCEGATHTSAHTVDRDNAALWDMLKYARRVHVVAGPVVVQASNLPLGAAAVRQQARMPAPQCRCAQSMALAAWKAAVPCNTALSTMAPFCAAPIPLIGFGKRC